MRGPIAYPTSALVVLWPAVRLSALLHGSLFDLAIAGYFYMAMFLFGVFLIVRGVRRLSPSRWHIALVALAIVVIFADTAYVAYFHSLYSEPASYTCLFITVGALLNLVADDRPDAVMLAIFTAAGAGLFTAKTQDLVLVLPLAGFCIWLALLHQERRWRVLVGASCLFIALMSVVVFLRTPSAFRQVNAYETVFLGILHGDSQAQARSDLQALGVDPRYAYLAGDPYFAGPGAQAQKNPAFVADFYGHVSQVTIVRFYLTHPLRLWSGWALSADAAMTTRPAYLGNFLPSAGMPPRALSSRFDLWSSLRAQVFPRSPWAVLVFFLAYLSALVYSYRMAASARGRTLVALCGLVGAWALLEFAMVYVADGTADIVKHMYLFDVLFDLMFTIGVVWIATQIATQTVAYAARRSARRQPALAPLVRYGPPVPEQPMEGIAEQAR